MTVSLFAKTIQLYVTSACEMHCPHCASWTQIMPNMSPETLQRTIAVLEGKGVERVELFANDPILHPQIGEFIRLLNESGLRYAILTVGASPKNPGVKRIFLGVLAAVDPKKGAFVFSVDYTEEHADRILAQADHPDTSYAFKAKTFWELAPLLQSKGIAARINVVISRYNVNEIKAIMRRAAGMGFATSFCFVQHRQPEFEKLLSSGLTYDMEQGLRDFMRRSRLLDARQIDRIVAQVKRIIATGELEGSIFNAFRGNNPSEGEISIYDRAALTANLLSLKEEFGDEKVLPSRDFIGRIGGRGFGCIDLLRKGQFPQLKIGSRGQMIFCCDLHDPLTQGYRIDGLDSPDTQRLFLEEVRIDPYIWLCLYFNPCDFSVNHVVYETRADVSPNK